MGSDKIINITNDNFDNEVINSSQPVLVDFWAEWCGPCKMLSPVMDEIAEKHHQNVKVAKVNVDSQVSLASKFQVMSIPTIMLFNNGEVVEKVVGARPREDLENMIKKVVI